MLRTWLLVPLPVCLSLWAAGDAGWKNKQIPEWTAEDAQQVLADSPWAKSVTPTVNRASGGGQPGANRGRRAGGIGLGGIGLGLPGGIGRRGGYPGGYPGGGRTAGNQPEESPNPGAPPSLRLRWESALPIREAELKARDTAAPTLDEQHYAIAVYGVPSRLAGRDPKSLADQLKKAAFLKRDGKKDLKPSGVEVLQREDGPVIVYLFPRSKEILPQDRRVELDARIGRLEFTQSFYLEDMVYQGKLEL